MKPTSLTEYEQSCSLAAKGKWNEALEKAKNCLARDANNRKYKKLFNIIILNQKACRLLEEGMKLEAQGMFQEAFKTYRCGLKTRTTYSKELKQKLKQIKAKQSKFDKMSKFAQQLYRQEKYTKAKAVIHQIMETTPNHPAVHKLIHKIENKEKSHILYGEAIALYKREKYKSAFNRVSASLQLDPNFTAAQILMKKISTTQTCRKYHLADDLKNKKKLHETIQFLENSIEPE